MAQTEELASLRKNSAEYKRLRVAQARHALYECIEPVEPEVQIATEKFNKHHWKSRFEKKTKQFDTLKSKYDALQ
jgi:hypothetical protein